MLATQLATRLAAMHDCTRLRLSSLFYSAKQNKEKEAKSLNEKGALDQPNNNKLLITPRALLGG
jgi:hypothetical protein